MWRKLAGWKSSGTTYCKRRVWQVLFRRMQLNTRLMSGIQLSLQERDDWGPFSDVFIAGEYDRAIHAVISHCRPGVVRILDLGANKGFFTLRFSDLFAQRAEKNATAELVLVEAAPALAADLPHRLVSIPREDVSIRVIHGLAGERGGVGSLALCAATDASHVISAAAGPGHRHGVCTDIQYVDLEGIYPGEVPIDLLKCDIEGSEYALIRNYPDLLRRTRILALEFHGTADTIREGEARLAELGFVTKTGGNGAGPSGVRIFTRSGGAAR